LANCDRKSLTQKCVAFAPVAWFAVIGLTVIAKSDADEGVSPDSSAGGQRRRLAKDFENLAELWAPRLHPCPQAACQGVGQ